MFGKIKEKAGKLASAWEDAAARWWDEALRAPTTLEAMGGWLRGTSELKARWDRGLEQVWSGWRLPSALDVERVHERLGELEQQLVRLEERLAERRA